MILVDVQKSVRKSQVLFGDPRRLSNRREQILHFDLSPIMGEAITKERKSRFLKSVCLYTFYTDMPAKYKKF